MKINLFPTSLGNPWVTTLCLAVCVLALGCGQNDVQVYRVARETPAPESPQQPQMPPMASAQTDTATPAPSFQWKRPEGWEELPPAQMRVASFRVPGKDGKTADVSVVPLPGMAGTDLGNVNRWRGQVGLPAVAEDDLPKLAQPVEIAGQPATLYEGAGTVSGSGESTRFLAAIQRRDGTAWFFKMIGEDQLVAQQKPAFVEFLKSASFSAAQPELAASHPPIADAGPPAPSSGGSNQPRPQWLVPPGWNEVSGGPMLVAKFALSGPENTQAAVNVSRLDGDGGGLMPNINRWRGQLGLPPEEDLVAQQAKSLAVAAGQATLVDMAGTDARTGQPARLVGVIVPQGGQTWFFKLMGNEQIVEREKDAFTKFVQTAKYPGAS